VRAAREAGEERARRPHRAEVVDAHRPLDRVRVVAEEARPRADAGVVDEQLDVRVPGEDPRGRGVDLVPLRDVARLVLVGLRRPP
jgi:hypothetical protein